MYGDARPHSRPTRTRREFVRDAFGGFGGLALASILHQERLRAGVDDPARPQAGPHPGQGDLGDLPVHGRRAQPSRDLRSQAAAEQARGPAAPEGVRRREVSVQIEGDAKLLGTQRTFKKYGESGIEVSDLFPHIAGCIDDIAVIRSCHGDMVVHSAAQYELFTGRLVPGFPSMGSWILYGLGSESDSLPSYVVMPDPKGALEAGQPMYTHGFLPAVYQPTMFRPGDRPVLNLDLPEGDRLGPTARRPCG